MKGALTDVWKTDASRQPPVIVAELSANHSQSLERALALIDAAADCGVDAVKFQTYTADTITLDREDDDFVVNKPGSTWHGKTLHALYEEAHTPWDWHKPMIERARNRGLPWFSSPFDFSAVGFLEDLGAPCFKVASPEIVDLPLIRRCAQTGKPIILSTGMATLEEIAEAVDAARASGATGVMLLKCTTDYPAKAEDANLSAMSLLAGKFQCHVGLSDHTMGSAVAVAATVLGARLIEKHLTLSRDEGGPDAHFSLEPGEMARLVSDCRDAWLACAGHSLGPTPGEEGYLRGRRSLYFCQDLRAGDVLTPENLRSIRPGFGLAPKHYESLLGRRAAKDVAKGTPVSWHLIAEQ